MAAVASASAGAITSSQSSADHPTPYMPSLSLPASFFSSLPPPASFFATLFAHHQNAMQPIPVAPPVIPHNIIAPLPPPQTPTAMMNPVMPGQQQSTPRSISPVPPGIYCDLGPAVFERTSRGYTVLRFEGYSFSKISDNRTKTYWRCANRTCRAKVHTNGGRIVYVGREPHVHKPRVPNSSGNSSGNLMAKVRTIKQSPSAMPPSTMAMMSTFAQQPQNYSSQNMVDMAPLDLRPKKEPSSVVIFDEDDKDMHSSSTEGGAKYEESAAAKSSSFCPEEDDELEIEGDDEADLPNTSLPVVAQSNLRTPPSSPSSSTTSGSPCPTNKRHHLVGSNNNKIMMTSQAIRILPRTPSEVELYRLLQRANLVGYYDVFVSHGGDDVQQLVEANEDEFAEILRLVDMTSKPLHVRRLQKILAEWVANPAPFRAPLSAAEISSFAASKTMLSVNLTTPATPSSVPGAVTASSTTKSTTGSSSISSSTVSPRAHHLGAGDAAISLIMMSAAAAQTGPKGDCDSSQTNNPVAPMNLSIVSHSAYPTASSSSSSGSPSVFFSSTGNANKAPTLPTIVRPGEEHSSDTNGSPGGEFGDDNSEASSFCSTSISEPGGGDNAGVGLLMLNSHSQVSSSKPVATLTNEVRNQIIQAAAVTIGKYPDLHTLAPRTDFSNTRTKASEVQQLLAILDMPRDQLSFLEGIHRFSMIFGRFDAKRKHPERRLSFHELTVNEAAAALCLLVPALLTHRERLYHLARQTVREVFHGHSISPLPNLLEQRSSFATPTPPAASTRPESHTNLKRKQVETSSPEKLASKQVRRSVITQAGEIIFPSQSDMQVAQDDQETASNDSKNDIAVALAKQFGFPELVDELQKDQQEEHEAAIPLVKTEDVE